MEAAVEINHWPADKFASLTAPTIVAPMIMPDDNIGMMLAFRIALFSFLAEYQLTH